MKQYRYYNNQLLYLLTCLVAMMAMMAMSSSALTSNVRASYLEAGQVTFSDPCPVDY
jgi:hypothetical protein